MKTILACYLRPDYCTRPTGIILRQMDDGSFATHEFGRERGSTIPIDFFWGHYFGNTDADQQKAIADFNKRVESKRQYTRGGSIIPLHQLDEELEQEKQLARA